MAAQMVVGAAMAEADLEDKSWRILDFPESPVQACGLRLQPVQEGLEA
jgi:hypothetical protein